MSIGIQGISWWVLRFWIIAAAATSLASEPSLPPSPFSAEPSALPAKTEPPTSQPAASQPPASQPASQPASSPNRAIRQRPLPTNRLTDQQINLLKVYEIDLNAKPPAKVEVPPDVIDAILRNYADRPEVPKGRLEQERLRKQSDLEQLTLLFKLRAKEFYGQVKVYGHPPSMERFRLKIHRDLVLNYCGTSQCHGDVRLDKKRSDPEMTRPVGGYFVFRQRPTEEATAYTNYLILAQFPESASGQRLINHAQPESSLLLQYALPLEQASYPHPKVRHWRPYFTLPQHGDFQMAVQWIKMLQSRSYPIDYQPKFEPVPPASQPAETPDSGK